MRLNMLSSTATKMRGDLALQPIVGEERLGVAWARYASMYTRETIVLTEYAGLPRNAYAAGLDAPVLFDTRWLMKTAENAAAKNAGILLVHLHEHLGKPWFSPIDMGTNRAILLPMGLIEPSLPTGALVLSLDKASALLVGSGGLTAAIVVEVGSDG